MDCRRIDAETSPGRAGVKTRYLVVDTESVPDGDLIAHDKYSGRGADARGRRSPRRRTEARQLSPTGSDFFRSVYQIPVAVCVVRRWGRITPCKRSNAWTRRTIGRRRSSGSFGAASRCIQVGAIWSTFNGRGFDMPLLELAAFRHGISLCHYIAK